MVKITPVRIIEKTPASIRTRSRFNIVENGGGSESVAEKLVEVAAKEVKGSSLCKKIDISFGGDCEPFVMAIKKIAPNGVEIVGEITCTVES